MWFVCMAFLRILFLTEVPSLFQGFGEPFVVESSDCPGVDSVVDRLQQIWTQVVDNLTLSQEKAQLFANRRRRVGPRLRVGDLVWLSSRHIPMKVSSPKFKPRFIGPYRISEILNPVSFRLTLPDSFSIHNVFHRSLLRRYVAPMVPSVEPPAPVLVKGELEYIVEKILDSRVSRRKLQYLVKWKGYAQEDNSWVFASDVHAPDLVRAFHVAHPGRPGGSACLFVLLEALRRKGCTAVPLVRHDTYLPVNRDPSGDIFREIQQLVKTYRENNVIDVKLGEFLLNAHPVVPVFYALPKIHKHMTRPPGRPIVASTNSLLSPLARTVEKILTPLLVHVISFIKRYLRLPRGP
ncbi:unnamed protein product [Ranitomeya imitator]|uniref:Chromo domain-containing protein n=1 Tax=Ranitomeya imitator TaxID=111125 RepID=A0ABN9LLM7_9NEOB|nr:unnamed protein product [Ranitomeya imitator]